MAKGDKYAQLQRYLENAQEPLVKLTFAEIEAINGYTLPVSATKHASIWWSNNYDHSQAIAWMDAGYETVHLADTYPTNYIVFMKK